MKKLPPWGKKLMTVCIAATCRNATGWAIVMCTDGLGSSALGTKENSLKIRSLPHKWHCLTAGSEDDITAMLQLLKQSLAPLEFVDETNIVPAAQQALRKRKEQKADEYTTRKWGMTFDDFRKSRTDFPEDEYRSDIAMIGLLTIDVDLLLCGFCGLGMPMIVQVNGDHGVSIKEDFAVAGSGSYLAQYGLLHRQHYDVQTLDRTIYCVYEAKKYAERVSSVGKITYFVVIQPSSKAVMLTGLGTEELEKLFANYGPHGLNDPDIVLPAGSFTTVGG